MDNSNNKKIIELLKKGDISAFEKTLFLYEKAIFNHIYRLIKNKNDAEDLTQETFIKLYMKHGQINLGGNFKAWLYKIATNTAIDFLRKKSKQREFFIMDTQDENQFETIGDKDAYYNIEQVYDLERAFEPLKPIYKTVLLLFYKEDFDYDMISKIINVPINTVKIYIHRAKKELKEILKQYG